MKVTLAPPKELSNNSFEGASVTFITKDIIPPSPFDLVYPLDSTTVVLTRDNFLDTLYFAWNQSVDTGGDAVTYKREMTGDLPEYIRFIVAGNETYETEETKSYSLSFDGVDDYVTISDNDALDFSSSQDYSIQFWFKTNFSGSLSAAQCFLAKAKNTDSGPFIGWQIFITPESGNPLLFNANQGYANGGSYLYGPKSSDYNDNKWHHISIVYKQSEDKAYFYFDGAQYSNYENHGSMNLSNAGDFYVGTDRSKTSGFFEGSIDDVRLWNKALSSEEITSTNYSKELGGDESSLTGYWKFNEETGSTVNDASGNSNNGTINGATWSTDSPIMSFKTIVGNMYKVPYHHIEHYMHEAGVELISGTWTIVATDGKFDTYATNGPFTLTIDGSKLNIEDGDIIPESFALHANYPNPFNPTTTISYDLPKRSQVTLGIYDLLGKQIKTLVNQSQDAGNKIAVWDGTNNLGRQVSAGVYLYQIQAGEFTQTRKMLFLK